MQNIKEYVANKKLALKERLKDTSLKAVIVQVGNVEASNRYVRNKIKDLEEVGIMIELIKLPEDISEVALLAQIHQLNIDDLVDAFKKFLLRQKENKPIHTQVTEKEVTVAERRKRIKFKRKSRYSYM